MEPTRVVPLDQYKIEASLAGCSTKRLSEIEKEIGEHPFHGHCLVEFEKSVCNLPLSGFYIRSWRYRSEAGGLLDCCTLHLFLSPDIPVYLFNISSCLEHEAPWTRNEAQTVLKAAGLEVFNAFATSGANA